MKPRLLPAALALCALTLGLAACGGGDSTTVIETTTVTSGDTSAETSTEETTTESTSTGTTDDKVARVRSLSAFQTPSGNIACMTGPSDIRCDIAKHSWDAGKAPSDCPVDYGNGISLDGTGKAAFVCAGDTVLNPEAPVLDYGESSQHGKITCRSEQVGLSCENIAGSGFFLSAQRYEFTG